MSGQHWCTPQWLVGLVHEVLDGPPDLDPFSNDGSVTGARVQWHGPAVGCKDGFAESWASEYKTTTVFLNPPWNRAGEAVRKALAEHIEHPSLEIVGLVPSSINSRHWPIIEEASARAYPNRRVSFVNPETGEVGTGNPRDVALFYFGRRPYAFAEVMTSHQIDGRPFARVHFGTVGRGAA